MPGPSLRSTEWVTPAKSRESTVVPICGDPLASRLDYPAPWLLPRSSEGTDDASVRLTILEVLRGFQSCIPKVSRLTGQVLSGC